MGISQSQAFWYLVLFFEQRLGSKRRSTLKTMKKMYFESVGGFKLDNALYGFTILKSQAAFRNNDFALIEHLCSFITDEEIKPGIICHLAELCIEGKEYLKNDLRYLQHTGDCLKLPRETVDNILHLVLSRELLVHVPAKEMFTN